MWRPLGKGNCRSQPRPSHHGRSWRTAHPPRSNNLAGNRGAPPPVETRAATPSGHLCKNRRGELSEVKLSWKPPAPCAHRSHPMRGTYGGIQQRSPSGAAVAAPASARRASGRTRKTRSDQPIPQRWKSALHSRYEPVRGCSEVMVRSHDLDMIHGDRRSPYTSSGGER